MTATLTTSDDPIGVFDTLDQLLTVSEAPVTDYIKHSPTVVGPVTDSGNVSGYVMLYPITLVDYSQTADVDKGWGPLNPSEDIDLYDHMWGLTANPTVATTDQMTAAGLGGRTPCGLYDGTGPYPALSYVGLTWNCSAAVNGAGGYPVVPITASGFQYLPYPANNADGSANDPDNPSFCLGRLPSG